MKFTYKKWFVLTGLLILTLFFLDARVNANASESDGTQFQVFSSEPVTPALSPALRDLAAVRQEPFFNKELAPIWLGNGIGESGRAVSLDPLAPNGVNESQSPSPLITFEGLGPDGFIPPDTMGDVGPNHYVQMVNVSVQIWDKGDPDNAVAPSVVLADFPFTGLFTGSGLTACATENDGDPIVVYDDMADRWLLSQFAITSGERMCIAISQTPDPTGAYYLYQFNMPDFPDYFKFGAWSDAYYMSTNTGFPNQYYGYAFDRTKMLAGQAATFQYANGLANFLMPADFDGQNTPPAGHPGVFYTMYADGYPNHPAGVDRLAIYEFDVDWVTPANSTFTLVTQLPIADYNYTVCGFFVQNCIPQPGTANTIDSLSYWPMFRFQYRNFGGYGAFVGNFTVDLDNTNKAAIRWFEIRKTGATYSLYQEGTYAPDASHRWMGSIAMDVDGNIALGYSVSNSTTVKPSIRYATRLAGDPLGTLSAEAEMFTGNGVQTSFTRWGDYSNLVVDPVSGCHFWYTNEYHDVNGTSWNTRVGVFKLDECGSPDFTLSVTPPSQAICTPNNAVYTVNIGQVQGYTDPVTLSAVGNPAGTTVGFSTNPVTPPGSSTLTIGNTGAAAAGSYNLVVSGIAPTSTHTTTVTLDVFTGVPGAPTLVSPANGATGVNVQPTLTWTGTAPSYFVEVASDAGFTNLVESATVGTTQYTLAAPLLGSTTYFWRVTGSNACGNGATSTVFSFVTVQVSTYCQAPNLAIPDNNPTGVTTSLVVADSGTLEDLNVYLDVTHTWVGDIAFNLTHQDTGTSVTFFDRPGVPASTFGCSGNDIDAWLDDEAALPVETQCGAGVPTIQGTFSPNNPLSAFDGEDLSGTWVLRASDHAGGDTGTVVEWCLEPSVPAGGASGTLQGSVTDAWSASGLNNASLTADDGSNTYTTSTDANGDYTLPLPVGTYQVTAEASGYFSATVSGVLLVTNTLTVQDFALLPLVVDLGLTPAAFDITQAVTSVVTHTLTISSVGTLDLTWTLEEEPAPVVVSLTGLPGVLAPLPGTTGSRAGSPSAASQPPVAYVSPADFSEDFADITNLPGWYMQNNSAPLGVTNWFQGNDTVFPAQAGAPTAYIGANFNNTAGTGTISNWLLTPELSLNNGDTLSFWTRTAAGSIWPDRLQLRLSTAGASTNVGSGANDVGDFTELLLDVNPTLTQGGYPEVWTQYTVTLSGLPNGVTGRFAFRYYVTNGGPSGSNSNYIGVDTVEYVSNPAPSVCASLGDIPWVSVSPASGTTAPGSSTDVTVAFDTSGLTVGNTYTGTLCLSSNDDDTPLVTIPLTLTVEAQSFGVALSGDQAAATETSVVYTLTVTNTGNLVDTFDLSATGVWTATLSDTSLTLGAGESATFTVEVTLPAGVNDGDMDVTTVTATSQSDATATASATLTTTAIVIIIPPTSFDLFLPLISR